MQATECKQTISSIFHFYCNIWRWLVSHLLTHTYFQFNCMIVIIAVLVGITCCPAVFCFLIDWGFWTSFWVLHNRFYVFFGKASIWVTGQFLSLVVCLTDVDVCLCIWETDFCKRCSLKHCDALWFFHILSLGGCVCIVFSFDEARSIHLSIFFVVWFHT